MAMEGESKVALSSVTGWSATSAGVAYFAGSAPLLAGKASELIQYATLVEAPLQLQILHSSRWTGLWVWMAPPGMVLLPIFVLVFAQSTWAKFYIPIGYLVFVIAFIALADRGLDALVREVGESLNSQVDEMVEGVQRGLA